MTSNFAWQGTPSHVDANGNKFYHGFEKDETKYNLHDFATTKQAENEQSATDTKNMVIQILECWQASDARNYLRGKLYYSNLSAKEVHSLQKNIEVLESDQESVFDIEDLKAKCMVEHNVASGQADVHEKDKLETYYCVGKYLQATSATEQNTEPPLKRKKQTGDEDNIIHSSESNVRDSIESKDSQNNNTTPTKRLSFTARRKHKLVVESPVAEASAITTKRDLENSDSNKDNDAAVQSVSSEPPKRKRGRPRKIQQETTPVKEEEKIPPTPKKESTSAPNSPKKTPKKAVSDENHQRKKSPSRAKNADSDGSSTPKSPRKYNKKRKKLTDLSSSEDEADRKLEVRKSKYKLGEVVWAKVKHFPWWPGLLVDEKNEILSKDVQDLKRDNTMLVKFFGSEDYAWVDNNHLLDFKENFKLKTKVIEEDLEDALVLALDASGRRAEIEAEINDEDVPCEVCKSRADAANMLLCDHCDLGYHLYCLNPKLEKIPDTNWYCPECKKVVTSQNVNTEAVHVMHIKFGVVGLVNIGSTCYINSSLQFLNAAVDFRKEFVKESNKIPDNELVDNLQNVITKMWSERGVQRPDLDKLRNAVGHALEFKYLSNQHQDINEFLLQLFEYLHQQYDKLYKQRNGVSDLTVEKSLITDFFEGTISRRRVCPNGHSFNSYEPFRILPLPFHKTGDRRSKVKLTDMIQDFCTEEELECRCSECGGNENKKFKQKTGINRFPKYLIIQLVRFASMMADEEWWSNKISTEVEYPIDLDLREIFPDHSGEAAKPVYELLTVVNHAGSVKGGHYWSLVKDDEDDWWNFNDNNVKQLKETEDLQSKNAYMLFYKRST